MLILITLKLFLKTERDIVTGSNNGHRRLVLSFTVTYTKQTMISHISTMCQELRIKQQELDHQACSHFCVFSNISADKLIFVTNK